MITKLLALLLLPLAALSMTAASAVAKTLRFSGYDFVVRAAGKGGPGPNNWDPANAWLDKQGRLHLKLDKRGGRWFAAEVYTKKRLGFGTYEFKVSGRVDKFDRNVVLGLFNYPPADVGEDTTNEIDIEFARWGRKTNAIGNYSIWPAESGVDYTTKSFDFTLNSGAASTHSFDWRSRAIDFLSREGHRTDKGRVIHRWTFAPKQYRKRIPQDPMPLHINLWAFQGTPPSDGKPVEIVIDSFRFTPN
ncbi:glycoside hydrolase family 16 protein [Rhizobium sp. TRM95111]|uniref:glycoside hydrolase family 16 protein n=1 Tax=Rhizobium alarense TaxID=2846851 RepID=UPI001F44D73B|nr:glycoside hydrolase family 16 protein [Rhizobium alarense]MCF3639164.1 glycoside hydrolase family 16 protein [Rhizobium alarense]